MTNQGYFNKAYSDNRDKWLCADAWADELSNKEPKKQLSAPFIVQVVNSNIAPSLATPNVDIGDSYTSRNLSNFGQPSGITTTSLISGTSYTEFLASSESHPFKVGRTMLISTTAGQLDQTIAVTHRNTAGKRQDFIIAPTLDPNQSQTDRVIDDTEYLFDGMTRLRINQVDVNTTLMVRIYPVADFSATRIIAGRTALEEFGAPDLMRTEKIALSELI